MTRLTYGGIAQLARAFGSYPECRWFESNCRYQFWPGGQEVKGHQSHQTDVAIGRSEIRSVWILTSLFFRTRSSAG